MKYTVIVGGLVENVILLDTVDEDIEKVFAGKELVEIDEESTASQGWAYANGEFLAPQSEPEPPTPAPRSVTMRQARLALLGAGKLPAVAAAIDTLPSPKKEAAQIEWEYATTVDRDSALMGLVGIALELDEPALDDLFTVAASL